MDDSFQWNTAKATSNLKKHGVAFEEATTAFLDFFSITVNDPVHSNEEDRFITIGYSDQGRLLIVVHVDRNDKIRIISARLATSSERRSYEQQK